MRKLLILCFFLPLMAWGQSTLPPCPITGVKHNCWGAATFADHKYVGEFQNDKFNGAGTYWWPDGRRYEGGFKDGKFHGRGTAILENGKTFSLTFKDGLPDDETFDLKQLTTEANIDITTCAHDDYYPRQSRQLGEQGTVVLRFKVAANGEISSIEIEKSSGHARLDKAAVRWVSTCKGKPSLVAGKPVDLSGTTFSVRWRLN